MKTVMIILILALVAATSPVCAVDSLSLAEVLEMAIEYSPAIKTICHDSAIASLNYDAARSIRFPTLSVEAMSYFVDDVQSLELPVPNGSSQRLEIGAKENYQADLTLSVPIFTGGKISRVIDIAGERSQAETSRLEAERMAVAYDCRRAYLNLLLAEASADIAQSSMDRVDIIRSDINHLYDNGLADSIDILETAQAMETARDLLDRQQTGFANAVFRLKQIIGTTIDVYPSDEIRPPGQLNTLLRTAEITRPELERLDHVITAADKAVDLAHADYYPSLNAFGGYSVGKPNRDMFDKKWDDFFKIGLSLVWQFELGDKTGKNAAAAHQAAQSSRMARKELEDNLLLQYQVSMNNLEHAFRIIKIVESEYDLARRKFNLARQKQREGQLSVNRLLEMEEDLTGAELRYRASVITYYLAETDFLYAAGSPKIYGGLR